MTLPAMASAPLTHETRELVRTIRDATFANGPSCVYCASTQLQRWGTFAGRQRFRCRACRRTFSDLTGTPLTRTKRIDRWATFLSCWQEGETVRKTAARIGVHPTTAFRWRHWLCDAIRENQRTQLNGWIEASHCTLPHSNKGARRASGKFTSHDRTRSAQLSRPRISVVVLHDRSDAVVVAVAGGRRPLLSRLIELYDTHFGAGATLLTHQRPYAPLPAAARALRIPHVVGDDFGDDPARHVANAVSYCNRLLTWLERFRGVATAYLPNYLAWHLEVQAVEPARAAQMTLRRCCRNPDQQLARTLLEGGGSTLLLQRSQGQRAV